MASSLNGVEDAENFEIQLAITVGEPDFLWHHAAQRLRAGGICEAEVSDTIGPLSDGDFASCVVTALLPLALPGCVLHDVAISAISLEA